MSLTVQITALLLTSVERKTLCLVYSSVTICHPHWVTSLRETKREKEREGGGGGGGRERGRERERERERANLNTRRNPDKKSRKNNWTAYEFFRLFNILSPNVCLYSFCPFVCLLLQ